MKYSQCLEYLNRLGDEILSMKLGLETIRTILRALGDPQHNYSSVAIVGTVGKGSVANIFNSIATSCGIRTGLYTSPHLFNVEERFMVGRSIMRSQDFSHYFTRVLETVNKLDLPSHPTYFEMLTCLLYAISCYQKSQHRLIYQLTSCNYTFYFSRVFDYLNEILEYNKYNHLFP